MSALAKPFLGILLLTFAGVSWAACPEGQKQSYKGCEVVEEKATEVQPAVQQEAKQVTSEILELGGFIAEEIQIEAAAGQVDPTELTVSPAWDDRDINWAVKGFKVTLPVGDFEMVSGNIAVQVGWLSDYAGTLETEETKLYIEPNRISVSFDSTMLPSVDYQDMRRCGRYPNMQHLVREFEEYGTIKLAFEVHSRIVGSHCMYRRLSEVDRATVTEIINQIETIVEKGTEDSPDVDYWKKIALRIKANGQIVIGEPGMFTTEMVVSAKGSDRGYDWLWRGFDVTLPRDGSEIVQGEVGMIVSWTTGSAKEPDRIRLKFDVDTLPSINDQKMRGCDWEESLAKDDGTIKLAFWGFTKFGASRCIYNKLSKADQALVSAFVNQIYNIVEKGTEGAPDADYWKKIAFRIEVNSPFILSPPTSGHHYCINAEDGAPVVYLAVEGNCKQSEHGPIERLSAAVKVRAYLDDISLSSG